jgi:hypothetical protein
MHAAEDALALDERPIAEVLAGQLKQVEGVEVAGRRRRMRDMKSARPSSRTWTISPSRIASLA